MERKKLNVNRIHKVRFNALAFREVKVGRSQDAHLNFDDG